MKKALPIKLFASKKSAKESVISALKNAYPEARAISLRDLKIIKTAMGWKSVVLRARCSFLINGRSQTFDVFGGWDKEIPEAKRRAFILLEYLWNNGFNQPPLLVPRPLVFDDKTALMLYIGYPGQTLYELLCRKSLKQAGKIFSLAGEWSARLHGLPPKKIIPRLGRADDEIQHKRNCATFSGNGHSFFQKKTTHYPHSLSSSILRQRSLIRKRLKTLSLIHNDLHIRNILTNTQQDEIAVIDFNESRLHDPLDDVAAFLVHLDVELARFFSKQEISRFQKIFLQSYLSAREKRLSTDEIQLLSTHAAWTGLRFLQYTLESNPPYPHRHTLKRALCLIEEKFWEIALNPSKFIKSIL